MAFDHNKLRGRIIEKFGSLGAFAKRVEISATALSNKITGKTSFSDHDIYLWTSLLGIQDYEVSTYFFTLKVEN